MKISIRNKIGLILILFSICLFIISIPFTSGYKSSQGIFSSNEMVIVIKEGKQEWIPDNDPLNLLNKGYEKIPQPPPGYEIQKQIFKGRVEIPFKWFFAVNSIILFWGIGLYIWNRRLQIISWLPRLTLIIGGILISLRFFFPPKYVLVQGTRVKAPKYPQLQPYTDIQTALLDALGIAVLVFILYFVFTKWTSMDKVRQKDISAD
jgi:hypothetical protein